MLTDQQRKFLLPKAYNAALRAGAAILDIYLNHTEFEINLKRDRTPITEADRAAHEVIRATLAPTLIPLLSEEGREMIYSERRGWDMFWLVDPLDGTKEFLKGNGEFTVNIALVINGRPVMGIVYVPYVNRIYFAEEKYGAYMKTGVVADAEANLDLDAITDGVTPLPLTDAANSPARIAISRSHNNDLTFELIDKLRKTRPDAVVAEQGSSYKFCMLAEGSIDFYIRTTHTYEWDTAAGEFILETTGGATTSLDFGEGLRYNKEDLKNPYFICRNKFITSL